MSEMVDIVARAIFADLQRQAEQDRNLYASYDYHHKGVTIDGGVDLVSFARAAIEAMREPTIDAALKSKRQAEST